ncbi:hypothetical protein, partial [Dyella sp. EPa41]|uniref:hypothetical protein n=1 Tax=Dyella sp. EPa41 TaxID=1561194 RepID=UPI001915FF2B
MTIFRSSKGVLSCTALLLLGGVVPLAAHAAVTPANPLNLAPDTARITSAIDNSRLTTLAGTLP